MELLAPAGNPKNFFQAINNGANAVYLGLDKFSARNLAENFTLENLSYYVSYAHLFNVKVYLAMNTLVKNGEMKDFISQMLRAYEIGVDAFILQDVFLGKFLKNLYPELTLHLSTQAGVCNKLCAKLAKEYGFSRVILSRETALKEIKEIAEIIETEVFVHGAMCSSFSGHCYFSAFIGGNSGNRGLCKQPCRKKYHYFGNDKIKSGNFAMSLSDLELCDEIDTLKSLGVSSVKIEGRMRSEEYTAKSVVLYRKAIDGKNYLQEKKEIKRIFNRGDYSKGYLYNQNNLISDKIQSHKGEYFAKITKVTDNFLLCDKTAINGDAFKIIRNETEIGNCVFKDGKYLYNGQIKSGDCLYITKDVSLIEKTLSNKKLLDVYLQISVTENVVEVIYNGQKFISENIVKPAINSPTTEQDVISCFLKTDAYPFRVKVDFNTFNQNIFIPKSLLNDFRRNVFKNIFYFKQDIKSIKIKDKTLKNKKFYDNNYNIIISSFPVKSAINVIKPNDYGKVKELLEEKDFKNGKSENYLSEKYLFVPAFLNDRDLSIIENALPYFSGIYADGLSGLVLAKKHNKKLIVGAGLNVFNSVDINVLENDFKDCIIVYSKELSLTEMDEKRIVYGGGNVSIMEFVYCPFKKNCSLCANKNEYVCKDEKFSYVLKRYKLSDCRFVLYNSAVLKSDVKENVLINLVGFDKATALKILEGDYGNLPVNGGRLKKGVL